MSVKDFEQDLFSLAEKVARNYRMIVAVFAFLYGCFVFITTQHKHTQDILFMQNKHAQDVLELRAGLEKIIERVDKVESNFNVTTAKLDTTLTRISADLQFIKQTLIEKGLK